MARELLTRDDADPATLAAEAGYVKRIFKRIAPAVVWLTLLDGTTLGVTPEHEVYTEAQGWRYVSELETSSSLVDATGAPLTIVAIEVDPTPRPVYNLETSCGTYFAQGVWAHNCFAPGAWSHIGRHLVDNPRRAGAHGVFVAKTRGAAEGVIKQAHDLAGPLKGLEVTVPMGATVGRQLGNAAAVGYGRALTGIRLVFDQKGRIKNAYPVSVTGPWP